MEARGKLPKEFPTPDGRTVFVGEWSNGEKVAYIYIGDVFYKGKKRPVFGQTTNIPRGHPSPVKGRGRSRRILQRRFSPFGV